MKQLIRYLYAVGVVFLIWWGAYQFTDSLVIPSPVDTAQVFVSEASTKLIPHTLTSYGRLAIATLVSSLIGAIIGIGCGTWRPLDRLLMPIVDLFYPIPRVAFLPIFLMALGLGEASKIGVLIAVSVFFFIIPVYDAVQRIPEEYQLIARTLRMTPRQWLRHVVLPAIIPDFFTAMRLTLGASMATLFYAENVSGKTGIGYYIMNAWSFSNYPAMYAGILYMSLAGSLVFGLLFYIEKRLTHQA